MSISQSNPFYSIPLIGLFNNLITLDVLSSRLLIKEFFLIPFTQTLLNKRTSELSPIANRLPKSQDSTRALPP